VVVAASSAAGKNEADLLGLPNVSVNFMPWSITVHDPHRQLYKRFAYAAFDKLVELMTIQPFNRLRRRQGLGPVGPEGMSSARLDLVPISPAVYAPNPLWESRHHVVGYWFVQEPGGWEHAADLLAFLENGEPPLLVSLGAMSLGDGDALGTTILFVEALQQAGARAVVQGWDEAMAQLDLPASIYAAGPLPHSWLLPRVAGMVHHGGFGTTAACLRAGAPQLVVPHIADQFFWGQRVRELGVGPAYIPRPRLTVEKLAAALDELLHNDDLRAAAGSLGEQVRAEDGVVEGVRLIEEVFG
jgi:UDP:flavonoid glycosyltransferase YjiC (YdhE family)